MTTKKRQKNGRTNRRFTKWNVRNKLEAKVLDVLKQLPGFDGYESVSVKYIIPTSTHSYTPDFKVGNVYYETKGIWDGQDRRKMLLVRDQHPDKVFVMVFYDPKKKIYKGSKTTYAAWCDKHGLRWTTAQQLKDGDFKL